jgi:DNA-binding NtrC family response regulator
MRAQGPARRSRHHRRPQPEMDGIELIRAILVTHPALPVIAISGAEDWADYLRIAGERRSAKIRKSVTAKELDLEVRKALGSASQAAQHGTVSF